MGGGPLAATTDAHARLSQAAVPQDALEHRPVIDEGDDAHLA